MKLKGNTTIQLLDSKTGQVVKEVTESNMITGAVDNVLNGLLNYVATCGNSSNNSYLGSMGNIYKFNKSFVSDLFGGIMVFNEHLDESADHIIPTKADIDKFIGCANSNQSITDNTYKGSYNSSESEITDEYAKFVYEFTTQQCNGDIACICLTSDIGGEVGLKHESKNYATSFRELDANIWKLTETTRNSGNLVKMPEGTGNSKGEIVDGNTIGYVRNSEGKFRDMSDALKQPYSLTSLSDKGKTLGDLVTVSYSHSSDTFLPVVGANMKYAYGKNDSDNFTSVIRFDKDGNSAEFPIPASDLRSNYLQFMGRDSGYYGYRYCKFFIKDNTLYCVAFYIEGVGLTNKARVYKITLEDGNMEYNDTILNDNFVKNFADDGTYTSYDSQPDLDFKFIYDTVVLYNKDKYWYGNHDYFIVDLETLTLSQDPSYTISKNSSFEFRNLLPVATFGKEPWLFTYLGGSYEPVLGNPMLYSSYLASINNIDSVLTKDATKVMKVIYTISKVE